MPTVLDGWAWGFEGGLNCFFVRGVARFGVEVAVLRPLEHAVVVFGEGGRVGARGDGETAFGRFKGGTTVGFELLN